MIFDTVRQAMGDRKWDKKLNIKTTGRAASNAGGHCLAYEPTPYSVLERLAASGYIGRGSTVVDYGCGKGRACFYLSHALGCKTVGVEYDPGLHRLAVENLARFGKGRGVEFVCRRAEQFEADGADCFYFFNPFSAELLRACLRRIADSCRSSPRAMRLFFYYPSDEYLRLLLTGGRLGGSLELLLLGEIDCRDLFGGDHRERIVIFGIEPPGLSGGFREG